MSNKEDTKPWEKQFEKEKKEYMMKRFSESFWSVEYSDGYGNDINIADGLCRIAEHLSIIAKSMSKNK
tara:strand:+ start:246 stop:449 length:204 start_codon:yes stop_codon:yes gene_type:complete